ncbi:twin-arginine translocation signal domain-containing protein [Halorussus ruber]|uniref:twin-arginine translocation signal domain-containing protein n=1 Tax=Halorussus ruber TaxID=1126238 RepID=UPI001091BE49|nr:twin-arginine translocation signal domain-containing protein [Halorussus ruber]
MGENTTFDFESDTSVNRRRFLKRSTAASLGLGLGVRGVGAQEQPGVDYYNFVVPDRGLLDSGYLNKFLFVTERAGRTDSYPFEGCFDDAEPQVEKQFDGGSHVYDAVLVDATEAFQLFGDESDGVERLREILDREVTLPDTVQGNISAIVATSVFAPVSTGRLPTTEGYRAVSGERCDGDFVRLRVHELPDEITG